MGCLFAILAVTLPRVAPVIVSVLTDRIALAFRGEWLWRPGAPGPGVWQRALGSGQRGVTAVWTSKR